ncbi:MAG: SDR family NAD(P)-dependent oxidoreductase [Myxococcota bacterium]|nr:SDR family NAD(P)-dependent oxidoreductase [Myxococcota bacterium]
MIFKREKLIIKDRVALITGAANGIGLATAKQIQAKGGIPICVDLPSPELDALANDLGQGALVVPCDVSDAAGMQRVVAQAVEKFGRLDIVVANAGIEKVGPSWKMPAAEFEQVLQVNILGVYRTIQPALKQVMKNKGHVVAVSSIAAVIPWPLAAAYGGSKAFVDSWMRSLRMELSGTGATAGAVYFGFIDTNMMKRAKSNKVAKNLLRNIPSIADTKPKTPERAAKVIIAHIEQRSARRFSHSKVRLLLFFRGVSQMTDSVISRHMSIGKSITDHYGQSS